MAQLGKGDRVGLVDGKLRFTEHGDHPPYGIITDVLSDGRAMVKWDSKYMSDHPVNPQNLLPENELQVKYASLEAEFDRVSAEVQKKLAEAGKIILDASKFAEEAGLELRQMYEATQPLENAMEEAGWSTSSWHC